MHINPLSDKNLYHVPFSSSPEKCPMRLFLASFTSLAALFMLTACAPHPASGIWLPGQAQQAPFSHLEVKYEGRAILRAGNDPQEERHCFWAGQSAASIALTCTPAFNPKLEEKYLLEVELDDRARLLQDQRLLMYFVREQS